MNTQFGFNAITTKYFGPTDTKGSRIKATFNDTGDSITIPYPYDLSGMAVHHKAAEALVTKHGIIFDKYVVASLNNGYIFIGINN
jgi:hypothetical protein